MNGKGKQTPMMRQFHEIKEQYPDAILFFRMGDFYEMFYDDAVEASKLLGLTLTKRSDVPMCGAPYHSVDSYIAKMIKIGRKIAICDQVEDPKTAKGLVKREVTRLITPGTVLDNKFLESKVNSFIMTYFKGADGSLGISAADLSTAEFLSTQIDACADIEKTLDDELMRFSPNELLVPESYMDEEYIRSLQKRVENLYISTVPDWVCEYTYAYEKLKKHFAVHSLKGFGLEGKESSVISSAALIHYLSSMQKGTLSHISAISYYSRSMSLLMDDSTIMNLELCESISSSSKETSLLKVIDRTITAGGGRRLRKQLLSPSLDINEINDRLSRAAFFYEDERLRRDLREILNGIIDVERLVSKLALQKINPKELAALKESVFKGIEAISMIAQKQYDDERFSSVTAAREAAQKIDRALLDDPKVNINEGDIIKDSFDERLAEYNQARREGRRWLSELEQRYRESTGIQKLKIRYNNVIGYFIEISKSNASKAPDNFVKRQTLVGSERYTSEELSGIELKINEANSKSFELENELYIRLREEICGYAKELRTFAEVLNSLDVYSAVAELAFEKDYCRPELNEGEGIEIVNGRHPVVEHFIQSGTFIPNDLQLDNTENRLLIITGPNMSGKSTFLRQNALIVLMAQAGFYVPAESAKIGLVDRIFTRVGASDSLAKGESTFLVEMNETANILNNCTERSLVIMDEIGRGTSTYDGMSIAWSIIEYLSMTEGRRARTLFATHYHELTQLQRIEGVQNFSVSVREHKGDIVFLKKVVAGPAKSSYGIYAAKSAGVPKEVSMRAQEILEQIEKDGEVQVKSIEKKVAKAQTLQPTLFDNFEKDSAQKALEKLYESDINSLTPLQAINLLSEIKQTLQQD